MILCVFPSLPFDRFAITFRYLTPSAHDPLRAFTTCDNVLQWLTFVSSALQLVAVPSLSGASDALGRKAVLGASLALDVAAKLALGFAPNSILAVSACQLVTGVCGAVLPVSQAIIIDLSQ